MLLLRTTDRPFSTPGVVPQFTGVSRSKPADTYLALNSGVRGKPKASPRVKMGRLSRIGSSPSFVLVSLECGNATASFGAGMAPQPVLSDSHVVLIGACRIAFSPSGDFFPARTGETRFGPARLASVNRGVRAIIPRHEEECRAGTDRDWVHYLPVLLESADGRI